MKKPKMITPEQAKELEERLFWRYKTIFAVSVESGMRISDVLKLKCGDVKKNPLTVYETKSKRKRTFELSEKTFWELEWQASTGRASDYVFQSERDPKKHVHRSTVHRQIKKALTALEFDASCHSARKLYARNIYDATNSVYAVQEALHHQKLSTTLRYLDFPQQNEPEIRKKATKFQNICNRFNNWVKKLFRR